MNKTNDLAQEFLDFLKKFSVVGLALGVIIGTAAKELVTSFTSNILSPLIALIPNMDSLASLTIQYDGNDVLKYGQFITDSLDFIILMFVVFFTVKFFIGRFMNDDDKENAGV